MSSNDVRRPTTVYSRRAEARDRRWAVYNHFLLVNAAAPDNTPRFLSSSHRFAQGILARV